jgi:hypothetical protein
MHTPSVATLRFKNPKIFSVHIKLQRVRNVNCFTLFVPWFIMKRNTDVTTSKAAFCNLKKFNKTVTVSVNARLLWRILLLYVLKIFWCQLPKACHIPPKHVDAIQKIVCINYTLEQCIFLLLHDFFERFYFTFAIFRNCKLHVMCCWTGYLSALLWTCADRSFVIWWKYTDI